MRDANLKAYGTSVADIGLHIHNSVGECAVLSCLMGLDEDKWCPANEQSDLAQVAGCWS